MVSVLKGRRRQSRRGAASARPEDRMDGQDCQGLRPLDRAARRSAPAAGHSSLPPRRGGAYFLVMKRFAALILGALFGGWLSAAAAEPLDVTGTWQAVELDPLLAADPVFGQYRYDMLIERTGAGLRIFVSLTGTSYPEVRRTGNRLTASGTDPTRGPTTLDIAFSDYTFEGSISFGSKTKKITGQLEPRERRRREAARLDAVQRESAAATEELRTVSQSNADLSARLARSEQALAAARRRIAGLEAQVEAAQEQAAQARKMALQRAAAVPAAAAGRPPAIEIIDPPPGRADVVELVDHGLARVQLTGRIAGGKRLLSLRANGRPVERLDNGLFRTEIALADAPATLEIVAIDTDGRRAARTLTLRPVAESTSAPEVTSGSSAKAAASLAATCYQKALAAQPPDPSGLDACRAALKAEPDNALNHYHLGAALSRLGRHREAMSAYREAAALWARQ
jgi:tetratricopeptide (TPR) repeat protein